MNATHLKKTEENEGRFYFGVQAVSGDSEKVRGWDLMTHGGFVTYGHHDADGLCTYVTPRSGSKIWVYLDTANSTSADRAKLFEDWDGVFSSSTEMEVTKVPMGALLLRKGDTL